MRLSPEISIVAISLVLGAGPLFAQAAPSLSGSFEARVAQASRDLANEPRFKNLSEEQRQSLVEFVVGNMLFSVAHEMGHAIVAEMELPVLGREEDAADSFAIVTGLNMMSAFSERVLIEAGKGWFFNDLRDKKQGAMTAFYDQHGMNLQRAYQIVCFMVGSAPDKFKSIAEMAKLPGDRQQSCQDDYAIAAWSWDEALKAHRRTPEQPKTRIDVVYGEGRGKPDGIVEGFKKLQFLELFADMAANNYVWRSPFSLEMQTCGYVNAKWSAKTRKVIVCYELADEFVELYREFADDPKMVKHQSERDAAR